MTPELTTTILVGIFGFLVCALFAVVAWFVVKSYEAVDKNMGEHSKAISDLVLSVKDLSGVIKEVQKEFSQKHDGVDRILSEHHLEIEMLRQSRHDIGNWITKICVQGQIKCNWEFASDFHLAGVNNK